MARTIDLSGRDAVGPGGQLEPSGLTREGIWPPVQAKSGHVGMWAAGAKSAKFYRETNLNLYGKFPDLKILAHV